MHQIEHDYDSLENDYDFHRKVIEVRFTIAISVVQTYDQNVHDYDQIVHDYDSLENDYDFHRKVIEKLFESQSCTRWS